MSEVITHGGQPYGYKVCRCNKCGIETTCTPRFDFYVRRKLDGEAGPLYCYTCLIGLEGLQDGGTIIGGKLVRPEAN